MGALAALSLLSDGAGVSFELRDSPFRGRRRLVLRTRNEEDGVIPLVLTAREAPSVARVLELSDRAEPPLSRGEQEGIVRGRGDPRAIKRIMEADVRQHSAAGLVIEPS
jgi:hypothetical protein